jgi:hypothetical protein
MSRLFVVDEKLKEDIKKMVEFAEANPFSFDECLDVYNRQALPAGAREGHYIETSFGIRIVYSIEQQPPGDIRHLSVGIDKDEAFPNPVIVEEIMKLIGFESDLNSCKVDLEKYTPTRGAVSVREVIKK